MEKLNYIELLGNKFPIKCDNYVLCEVQKKYGTLYNFEKELTGITTKTDKQGEPVLDQDGNPVMFKREPSVGAINFILPLMVNEGIEIEAYEKGMPAETLDSEQIVRMVDMSIYEVEKMIHEEFGRCFLSKKKTKQTKKKNKNRLTLLGLRLSEFGNWVFAKKK